MQTSATDPQTPLLQPVHELGTLTPRLVTPPVSRLWNEYIQRYHYLGSEYRERISTAAARIKATNQTMRQEVERVIKRYIFTGYAFDAEGEGVAGSIRKVRYCWQDEVLSNEV